MRLKVSSVKWRPFCLGLNVLNQNFPYRRNWRTEPQLATFQSPLLQLHMPATGAVFAHNGRHFVMTFPNYILDLKLVIFWFRLHWNVFTRVQLTINDSSLVEIMAWRRTSRIILFSPFEYDWSYCSSQENLLSICMHKYLIDHSCSVRMPHILISTSLWIWHRLVINMVADLFVLIEHFYFVIAGKVHVHSIIQYIQ